MYHKKKKTTIGRENYKNQKKGNEYKIIYLKK